MMKMYEAAASMNKDNDSQKLKKPMLERDNHFVFVKNFKKKTTIDEVRLHFYECGTIDHIYMPKRSRYCFVYFKMEKEVTAALSKHGSMLGEHQIIVRRGVLGARIN